MSTSGDSESVGSARATEPLGPSGASGAAEMRSGERSRVAVVLAAGKGTRMRSGTAKVMHVVGGRSSLEWVLHSARACGCEQIFVVVGPEGDAIKEVFREQSDLHWVVQPERKGTGHALQVAVQAMEATGIPASTALVLYADAPLVTVATLTKLFQVAERGFGALSVATLDEPGNLGRVQATDVGQLEGIVEVADAKASELELKCVNAGHYALPYPEILPFLEALEPVNEQGELYLTDAVVAAAEKNPVLCVELGDSSEAWGINTRADLARVHEVFCQRTVTRLQELGVTILRPSTVTLEATVEVAPDAILHAGISLLGTTKVGAGTVVHTGAWIKDSEIGAHCEIRPYSVLEQARLADRCGVGPFARLRAGAELDEEVHVGNFVEVKKSKLAKGVKAGHLAYLGDATVGANSNIGAGVVTCNYDGQSKHATHIGEGAFVGSDTMLIAPVVVGDGATTAAGSVITHAVPEGALAVGRSRQRNIEDWAKRSRKNTPASDGTAAKRES